MILEILKYPDPRLLTLSAAVEKFDDDLLAFVDDMQETIRRAPWGKAIGMAAVQCGRNIRLFIARDLVYVNPEIVWKPKAGEIYCREGCFSLEPNRYDYGVTRPYALRLKWQDLRGESHESRFNGFDAQVIQHEYDHVEGRLCVDNIRQLEQKGAA